MCSRSAQTASVTEATFDLLGYARQHRYRTRNLHDGYPAPPARRKKDSEPISDGHWGDSRWDVIVGYDGYLYVEESGMIGIHLSYKSAKGVNQARKRVQSLGGNVTQDGDVEIGGILPLNKLAEALKLIRVSKLSPGNRSPNMSGILPRSNDANGS